MLERLRLGKIWKMICENSFLIIVGMISFIVVFSPNIQKDLITGYDYTFHLARIETLALSMKNGVFPVKVHSDLCYGFGYGVGFFYSNFFLYIPAVLINMGLSLEVAYKIFVALMQIGILGAAFFAAFKLTRNKYSSLFAAVLYIFSISVLESFYKHFTVGRSSALIFLPLAIAGIYLIINTGKDSMLFIVGFCGLIYSHVLTTVTAVIACMLIAVVCWKKWINKWVIWKKLIISTIIVLLLTAAYWIPLMEQWLSQTYRASEPWTFVDENVVRLYDLFNNSSISIVLVGIIIFMGLWFTSHWNSSYDKTFYFIGLGVTLITTVSIFWVVTKNIFKFLQYPDRLLGISTVCLIFAVSLWLLQFNIKTAVWEIIISILLIINIYHTTIYLGGKVNDLEDFSNRALHEEIAGLGSGEEWLPIQTYREHLVNPTTAYDDSGNPIEGIKEAGVFYLPVDGESTYYDIPFVWYKGYAANVNGEDLEVVKIEENGLVRVMMDDINVLPENNNIIVWYKGTILQKISYAINLLGVLCLGIGGIILKIKNGKNH